MVPRVFGLLMVVLAVALSSACIDLIRSESTPTPVPIPTPTRLPGIAGLSPAAKTAVAALSIPTAAPTPTPTRTPVPTAIPRNAPVRAPIATGVPGSERSPGPTPISAPVVTPTPSATPTPAATPIPTPTPFKGAVMEYLINIIDKINVPRVRAFYIQYAVGALSESGPALQSGDTYLAWISQIDPSGDWRSCDYYEYSDY